MHVLRKGFRIANRPRRWYIDVHSMKRNDEAYINPVRSILNMKHSIHPLTPELWPEFEDLCGAI